VVEDDRGLAPATARWSSGGNIKGPHERAGAYVEAKARLARRLSFDGSCIVVEGIIHGLRAELKKDVMMMRPQTIEDLIDIAEVSESSYNATTPATKPSDSKLAADIADIRTVVTAIAANMPER